MQTSIAATQLVPAGIRDPLVSSRYAEAVDLNPNQLTTVGDASTNPQWTMVRCDRPVLLWPIRSQVWSSTGVQGLRVVSPGSGYTPLGQTFTLSGGGAAGTYPTATLTSVSLVSASMAVAGTGYEVNDSVTVSGYTGTAPTLSVATLRAISGSIASGGTGYSTGTLQVVGGTQTTPAQLSFTQSGGVITSVTVTQSGSYTVRPANPVTVTGGGGSGATLNLVWGVNSVTIVNGGDVTGLPASPANTTGGSGTGLTVNLASYGASRVTLATAGALTALPTSAFASSYGGSGTGATFVATGYTGAGASTTFNSGSARVIYYAPNRIPVSVDYTQRSKGAGIVYLPNPGTWYLQHARDNTAEAITTEYIVIDAQDPAVIARYLAESGCHRVRTTQVTFAASGARYAIIGENRNRTGLLISAGTGNLGAAISLQLAFGTTATATNSNMICVSSNANYYGTGEQVWKGSVDGWFSGTAPGTAFVTEWE